MDAAAQGIIFSIEEFALNDGPGIRTAVFFKGCHMRCSWCHNPEGLSFAPQTIRTMDGDTICGERTTADELAGRLAKNAAFLKMTDGGVTITGGEPLAQPDFLAALLALLRAQGMHTAIETSGHAPAGVFRRIVPLADLVLFDIKGMDAAIHKKHTGVDNTLILANLEWLAGSGAQFIVRLPLIPGVNDSAAQMQAVLEAIKDAPGLVRVEMLRYHKTAGAKHAMAGMEYKPTFDVNALPQINNVFERHNIKTIIL